MSPGDIALGIFGLLLHLTTFAHFRFIELCLQLTHGLLFVAVLASVILTHRHNACRDMRDANSRFGLLNMLTAGAGGAENVHAQIGRIDFHFKTIVDFRINVDARKRGMTTSIGILRFLPAIQP